jgi:hypothetical protein
LYNPRYTSGKGGTYLTKQKGSGNLVLAQWVTSKLTSYQATC